MRIVVELVNNIRIVIRNSLITLFFSEVQQRMKKKQNNNNRLYSHNTSYYIYKINDTCMFFSLSLSLSLHFVNILSHQQSETQVLDWITLIDSIYNCCLFILTVIRRVDIHSMNFIHTHRQTQWPENIYIASCKQIEIESKMRANVFAASCTNV